MESLAKHLSRMIENFETTQKLKDRSEISKSYHFYLKQLLERPDSGLAQIVAESPEKFLGMTRSQSGAITYKDQVTLIGDPKITLQQITKLREHLNRYSSTDVFVTENLSSFFSAAQEFSKSISGMISACLSRSEGVFFFWFKPEETEVIHWAGEPKKNQLPDVHSGIIHPRKSFEVWQEISRDRSSIWEEAEIVAASDFLKLFNSKSKIC
jgi:light-regulated signal transduction histidine kinase (bacteriophytochrome)